MDNQAIMQTPSWVTDAIFYQIFPDRFAHSERLPKEGLNFETWDSPPTIHGFKGGDLFGVTEHLDYLQDLGINAIYLNPVFSSASNHRYHTYDYFNVDPLLGGNEALRELLDHAHKLKMHVILDGVFNHTGRGFWQFHHTLENGASSPYVSWFHFDPDRLYGHRNWGAYPTPQEQQAIQHEGSYKAIGYQGWWNLPALPKLNTGTPAVREFIFQVAEHWLQFGIDGWRLDVPGEIDDDSFWQEFRRRVRAVNPDAYLVGEIWSDARRWLQGDQFDASMNYPVTGACLGFLTGKNLDMDAALQVGGYNGLVNPMDANQFADRIDSILRMYRPEATRVEFNLLDSHDTPRFLTCARGDLASLQLALTFILTYPGAPCIFYGDEIGISGRQDPECRQPFPWDKSRWNRDLLKLVKALIALRKSNKVLRWGNYQRMYSSDGVYSFVRTLVQGRKHESVLIALNAAEDARAVEIGPLTTSGTVLGRPRSRRPGTKPQVIFGHAGIHVESDRLRLTLPGRAAAVIKT